MSATQQVSDERLAKIASTLLLAHAAMAGAPNAPRLVGLTEDDAELFEISLHTGEFLAFLDRNPQFEALSPREESRDLTWDECAAADLSMSEFVNRFRTRSD
jgi:hypothetical protein